jgi:hypothetical protein
MVVRGSSPASDVVITVEPVREEKRTSSAEVREASRNNGSGFPGWAVGGSGLDGRAVREGGRVVLCGSRGHEALPDWRCKPAGLHPCSAPLDPWPPRGRLPTRRRMAAHGEHRQLSSEPWWRLQKRGGFGPVDLLNVTENKRRELVLEVGPLKLNIRQAAWAARRLYEKIARELEASSREYRGGPWPNRERRG